MTDVRSAVQKAWHLKRQGKYDEAAALYKAVLDKDANNVSAHWGLAWILAEQGKKQEAIEHFRKVVKLSKKRAWVREAKAALKRLGAE